MKTVTKVGVCPVYGQSLVDENMFRRVQRAQAATPRALERKLRADLKAQAVAEVEEKYATETARAKSRIDELQRQLDGRSAHDRGDRHEQDVGRALEVAFPTDRIERHGRRGDILQIVIHREREVGVILYECKNAGNWQNAWIPKLKEDARKRRTPYQVLVTRRLPGKQSGLCVRDDVAICEPANVIPIATIMRQWVVAAHRNDLASEEVPSKARRLYDYLAGDDFRADFMEIVNCTNELDSQVAIERDRHERAWNKQARLCGQLRSAHMRIGATLDGELEGHHEERRELVALVGSNGAGAVS